MPPTSGTDGVFGQVPEVNVGFSDAVLLVVSGVGFVMLAWTVYSIVILRLKSAKEVEEEDKDIAYDERLANADVATLNRAQRRARAKHIMKQQRRIAQATNLDFAPEANDQAMPAPDDAPHDELIPAAANGHDASLRNLSRKQRNKAAKAAEKEERRLFDEERRREQAEAERLAREEKRVRDRLKAERVQKEREERQKHEEVEELRAYNEWKTFLSSEDGTNSISVLEWKKELQKTNLVTTEELAKRFRISRTKVASRIKELVSSLRVTGILEEDGRFIYFSPEEMGELANFIRSRNKSTLEQIADEAQRIISK